MFFLQTSTVKTERADQTSKRPVESEKIIKTNFEDLNNSDGGSPVNNVSPHVFLDKLHIFKKLT